MWQNTMASVLLVWLLLAISGEQGAFGKQTIVEIEFFALECFIALGHFSFVASYCCYDIMGQLFVG